MVNQADGRIATLPVQRIGKIIGHKGFNVATIFEDLVNLFETSILLWSEPEIQREGHKSHDNIKAYHHYLNKFAYGSGQYFI